MDKPVAKLKLLTTEGKVVDAILYCHQETTTVGGTTYYLLKVNTPADASGTTLSASTANVARVVWGKFVYPLAGIVKILSATIYATYRAYTGGGTVNAEIDILIRKSDGTVRTTIATGVSKSANLGTAWATLTGDSYSFAEYTVVDQTDYLEINYIANVTAKKSGQYAYLRIDDNTLALADQTRSQEWKFTGVTTLDATNITVDGATLNGRINGTETLTVRGFEWGKQSGNYTDSWTEEGSFPPGSFSHSISGLDPDTTYYFRAKAYSSDAGWIYGNELSFHTLWAVVERTVNVSNESVNPTSGFVGDSVTYQATVLDSAGEPLPSSFMADLVMDSITLVYNVAFTSDVYNPSNGLLTLQFTVPDVFGTRTVRLDALLTDDAGNPLAGKTLTFKHKLSSESSWTTIATRTTGNDGKASLTIDVEANEYHDFRVEFAGDGTYEASYDEELNVYVGTRTRSVKLEALLTDDVGNPLEGKTLTFKHKLSSEQSWITDGAEVTGSDGKASLTIDVETHEYYDFRVEFAGDNMYEASYDEELNVYIAPKTSYTVKLVWLEQTI